MCKDADYSIVQKCQLFQQSLSDDQIIDDIISKDPEKSNKVKKFKTDSYNLTWAQTWLQNLKFKL